MAYRPNHPVIIVVNANGGGYVKQFDTMSEAKDFYKTITTDGVAYLYAAPKASLGFGNASDSIPEYNNGITYGTGALVKLNGTVYKLINFIGAGGYGPVTHPAAWTTNVTLPPPSPPISSTGSNVGESKGMAFTVSQLPFGNPFSDNVGKTLISSEFLRCDLDRDTDADGITRYIPTMPVLLRIYSDGSSEEEQDYMNIKVSPCFMPEGFKINRDFDSENIDFVDQKVLKSLNFDGNIYGPYYNLTLLRGQRKHYFEADGIGSTRSKKEEGIILTEEHPSTTSSFEYRSGGWINYVNGEAPYINQGDETYSFIKSGHPIPNGRYLITYKIGDSEQIHSGYWRVSVLDSSVFPATLKWVFEPESPEQPPPPPCSILKKVLNPVTEEIEDACDPDIVYPFSVYENCAEPLVVDIEGSSVTLGTNTKRGMDDGYGNVVWGQCTGLVYVPNGQLVHDGLDYYYYSDGAGSYTAEAKQNNCPPAGSILNRQTTELTVSINAGSYVIGYQHEDVVANGNCGSGMQSTTEYLPDGTYIFSDSSYIYYSNGQGSYYTQSVNPPYGTELSTDGGSYTANAGCGDYNVGYWSTTTYADGMGGTYSTGGSSYTPNGQFVGNCNDYNYYSNGQGGLYQGEYTGQSGGGGGGGSSYPSYGTTTGNSGSGDNSININGSYYPNGTYSYTEYHDGNGGFYNEYSYSYLYYGYLFASTSYYDSETMSDVYTYYYSDNNGGYYQQ
jgi:hypothetical protein